jgi:hypothetical protein
MSATDETIYTPSMLEFFGDSKTPEERKDIIEDLKEAIETPDNIGIIGIPIPCLPLPQVTTNIPSYFSPSIAKIGTLGTFGTLGTLIPSVFTQPRVVTK